MKKILLSPGQPRIDLATFAAVRHMLNELRVALANGFAHVENNRGIEDRSVYRWSPVVNSISETARPSYIGDTRVDALVSRAQRHDVATRMLLGGHDLFSPDAVGVEVERINDVVYASVLVPVDTPQIDVLTSHFHSPDLNRMTQPLAAGDASQLRPH